jgi:hypothetical protein
MQQVVCDECGRPIDPTLPYYTLSGSKVKQQTDDAGEPTGVLTAVDVPRQLDYHEEHLPMYKVAGEPVPGLPGSGPLALVSLDPAAAIQNGREVMLRALGTGFLPGATIVFDGAPVETRHVGPGELICTMDAQSRAAGTFDVLVRQAGDESASLPFTIAPVPELSSLNPTELTRTPQPGTVTLHALGADFIDAAVIVFNGTAQATTFVSDTELTCELNSSSTGPGATPDGIVDVLVAQVGAESASLPFTIV